MPGNDIINAARAWWELNQAALLANQFDQVRQPETYPPGPNPAPPSPPPSARPVTEPAPPTPPPASPSASVPTVATAAPPARSSTLSPWWLAVPLALVALVVLRLCKRPAPRETQR